VESQTKVKYLRITTLYHRLIGILLGGLRLLLGGIRLLFGILNFLVGILNHLVGTLHLLFGGVVLHHGAHLPSQISQIRPPRKHGVVVIGSQMLGSHMIGLPGLGNL